MGQLDNTIIVFTTTAPRFSPTRTAASRPSEGESGPPGKAVCGLRWSCVGLDTLLFVRFQLPRPLSSGRTPAAGDRPRRRASRVSCSLKSIGRRDALASTLSLLRREWRREPLRCDDLLEHTLARPSLGFPRVVSFRSRRARLVNSVRGPNLAMLIFCNRSTESRGPPHFGKCYLVTFANLPGEMVLPGVAREA
jgi:hypothetical protein